MSVNVFVPPPDYRLPDDARVATKVALEFYDMIEQKIGPEMVRVIWMYVVSRKMLREASVDDVQEAFRQYAEGIPERAQQDHLAKPAQGEA